MRSNLAILVPLAIVVFLLGWFANEWYHTAPIRDQPQPDAQYLPQENQGAPKVYPDLPGGAVNDLRR